MDARHGYAAQQLYIRYLPLDNTRDAPARRRECARAERSLRPRRPVTARKRAGWLPLHWHTNQLSSCNCLIIYTRARVCVYTTYVYIYNNSRRRRARAHILFRWSRARCYRPEPYVHTHAHTHSIHTLRSILFNAQYFSPSSFLPRSHRILICTRVCEFFLLYTTAPDSRPLQQSSQTLCIYVSINICDAVSSYK